MAQLCGGARLYPGRRCASDPTMRIALGEAIRQVLASTTHSSEHEQAALDAGFLLLRRLDATAALGARVTDSDASSDPRAASAPLAHRIGSAETVTSGSLLVSHPLYRRDVVLVLSAHDGADGFCMGLVINQPTGAQVGGSPLLRNRGQTVGPAARRTPAAPSVDTPRAAPLPLPRVSELLKAAASGVDLSHRLPQPPPPPPLTTVRSTDAAPTKPEPVFKRSALLSELKTKRVGGPTAQAPSTAPTSSSDREEWTTGNRKLTDPLASQRRTRDRDLDVFSSHTIHYGGPEGGSNVTMVHSHASVRGCVPVQGAALYYGGDLAHAAELVRAGEAHADDFTFFKGRVDWRPGELRGEIDFGEWVGLTPFTPADADGSDNTEPITALIARAGVASAPDANAALADVVARRRYRQAAWSSVVGAAVAADDGAGAELATWLALRPLEGKETEELEAISAVAGSMPPWRAKEGEWQDTW